MRGSFAAKACVLALGGLLSACASPATPPEPTGSDWSAMERATQAALESTPTGESRSWINDETSHRGTVIPVRTVDDDAAPCREYQQTFTAEGTTQVAYGYACRGEDGSWETTDYTGFSAVDRRGRAYPRHAARYPYPYDRYGYHRGARTSFGFGVGIGF